MAIGSKTGGRKRGTPNKATAATPLDFAIATMRRYAAKAETWELIADDETATPSERAEAAKTAREYTQFAMDAAKTAAPYVHPKLTAIAPPEPGQPISPLPPLQLVVQFEASDPRLKPSRFDGSVI